MGEPKTRHRRDCRIALPRGDRRGLARRRGPAGRGADRQGADKRGRAVPDRASRQRPRQGARATDGASRAASTRCCMNTGCRARRGCCCSASPRRCSASPMPRPQDRLIAGTIGSGDWARHLGRSDSLLVNASTWGLMLTGRIVDWGESSDADLGSFVQRLIARSGEPVIRQALRQAMRILGRQFVLGETIARGARQWRGGSGARLSLLLRHAGRGGAHRRGRSAPRRALPRGGRGHRGVGGRSQGADRGGAASPPRAVGQALGAASALSAFARGAAPGRAGSAALGAGASHARGVAPAHDRCRGGRQARPLARAARAALRPIRRCRGGTDLGLRCRPTASGRCR